MAIGTLEDEFDHAARTVFVGFAMLINETHSLPKQGCF